MWVELLSPLAFAIGLAGDRSAVVRFGRPVGLAARGATVTEEAASTEVLFREALSEYLQGSWFEAETILGRLLHLYPRDVEARLLLATLLRHTRRYQEALDQLDRLERLRDARPVGPGDRGRKRLDCRSQADAPAGRRKPRTTDSADAVSRRVGRARAATGRLSRSTEASRKLT